MLLTRLAALSGASAFSAAVLFQQAGPPPQQQQPARQQQQPTPTPKPKPTRIPVAGGAEQRLFPAGEIVKLAGVSADAPDTALVVRSGAGKPIAIGMLSLADGGVAVISHETESEEGRAMLAQVLSWERTYCNTTLYVETVCERDMAGECRDDAAGGTKTWTDVKMKRAYKAPLDVSNCAGLNCGQPSLSLDGQSVAYVMEAR
jgi:hypothetical protein